MRGGLIGVDVGGTHTDVIVVQDRRLARGKALTTYADFAVGALEAIEVAASSLEQTLSHCLEQTALVVNATTVVTNAIAQLSGARVGVLVTAGFRDTFQLAGGPRLNLYDDHLQTNVPRLVAQDAIVEIEERVNSAGEVLVPLREDACLEAIAALINDREIEAVALCLLQSHANPVHEVALQRLLNTHFPHLFVSPSHALYPVRGETRRWNTAILNAFVFQHATSYLDTMHESLAKAGLGGKVVFFQGLGGCITREQAAAHPLSLLRSGPAGGVIGACHLARELGHEHFLLADMGGTSLEATVMAARQPRIANRVDIERWRTGAKLVDVASIGAGGGSIAWVSERGAPQVGPQSAGSIPGPAAYGRGGQAPTVTDAMVSLGFMDPTNYLGGRATLRKDLADGAVSEVFGLELELSLEDAASAIHDLVASNMSAMIREVTVDRGHDPRGLTMIGFGGMFGLFAGALAKRLEVAQVVLPRNASAFSAWGLLVADFVVRKDRSVDWLVDDDDVGLSIVNRTGELLVAEARADIAMAGLTSDQVTISRSLMLQFKGQSHQLEVPVPDRPLTRSDSQEIQRSFLDLYRSTYGTGATWRDVPILAVEYSATAIGSMPKPAYYQNAVNQSSGAATEFDRREIYLPDRRRWTSVPVFHEQAIPSGATISGPAIVDASDTTIFVPDGMVLIRDELGNLILQHLERARAA